MSEDLANEIEAINSIYGDGSLVAAQDDVYILDLPRQAASLRIRFPSSYPAAPPTVLGIQSSGERVRIGKASEVVDVFRDALTRLFRAGEVCLFDVIEEVNSIDHSDDNAPAPTSEDEEAVQPEEAAIAADANGASISGDGASWILSDVVTELKSVFVARCAEVSSPEQASRYVQHLVDSDKKVRSGTHNITAWRIRGENGVSFQDCDDDGESAAGGRVLHLMQLMDLWDVMVVVTRWYGGHQLGPKRFSIINAVARDAFVKAGLVKEEGQEKKKGKGKR